MVCADLEREDAMRAARFGVERMRRRVTKPQRLAQRVERLEEERRFTPGVVPEGAFQTPCPLAGLDPTRYPSELKIGNFSEIIWDPRTPKSIQNSAFSEIL